MVIDSHAHIYPDKLAEKAVAFVGSFYSMKPRCDGTANTMLRLGQSAGIDRYVVHSAAQSPAQVKTINNYIAAECAAHPELIGFGTLHKDMSDPGEEVERMIMLGLKGVKLHPDMQKFNIDDPSMYAIYAYLEGRLPVLMHCGDYRYTWSHPARLAKVLALFPRLTVIAAHFGGWSIFDLALEHLQHTQCYLDISSSVMFLGDRRAEELIGKYGAERILFGSDYPMWNPAEELERFHALKFPQQDRELILSHNILRILP